VLECDGAWRDSYLDCAVPESIPGNVTRFGGEGALIRCQQFVTKLLSLELELQCGSQQLWLKSFGKGNGAGEVRISLVRGMAEFKMPTNIQQSLAKSLKRKLDWFRIKIGRIVEDGVIGSLLIKRMGRFENERAGIFPIGLSLNFGRKPKYLGRQLLQCVRKVNLLIRVTDRDQGISPDHTCCDMADFQIGVSVNDHG